MSNAKARYRRRRRASIRAWKKHLFDLKWDAAGGIDGFLELAMGPYEALAPHMNRKSAIMEQLERAPVPNDHQLSAPSFRMANGYVIRFSADEIKTLSRK